MLENTFNLFSVAVKSSRMLVASSIVCTVQSDGVRDNWGEVEEEEGQGGRISPSNFACSQLMLERGGGAGGGIILDCI